MISGSSRPKASPWLRLFLFLISGGIWAQSLNEKGTLVFIGVAKDGIVFAADSAVYSSDGELLRNDAHKVIAVGKLGGLVIAGATRMRTSHGDISLYDRVVECAGASRD